MNFPNTSWLKLNPAVLFIEAEYDFDALAVVARVVNLLAVLNWSAWKTSEIGSFWKLTLVETVKSVILFANFLLASCLKISSLLLTFSIWALVKYPDELISFADAFAGLIAPLFHTRFLEYYFSSLFFYKTKIL